VPSLSSAISASVTFCRAAHRVRQERLGPRAHPFQPGRPIFFDANSTSGHFVVDRPDFMPKAAADVARESPAPYARAPFITSLASFGAIYGLAGRAAAWW